MAKDVANIAKTIEIAVIKGLKGKLTTAIKKQITDFINSEVPALNREALAQGIMADGKRAPKLSVDYEYWKRRFVKGNLNHRKKSKSKSWYKNLYGKITVFKAKRTPNYGVLRGWTFGNLTAKSKVSMTSKELSIKVEYPVTKKDDIINIIKGLKEQGRDYYGLAPDTTPTGKKQRETIINGIKRILTI